MQGKQRRPTVSLTGLVVLVLCITMILNACSRLPDQNIDQTRPGRSEAETASTNTKDLPVKTIEPQETEEEEMDKQHVIARYQAVQQAMIDKNIDTLDEIILDGTTFRHMSGKTQTKDEYFADIRDGRLDYQSYTMTDAKVLIDGDDATLTCRVVLTANAYGAQGSWPFNVTAHLVRIDGEWYMTN